jgi:GWxTD domain-containing protein
MHLQYVLMDSVYSARYQISIGISKLKGASVLTEDKTFNVTEKSYAVTIDPKSQRAHRFEFQLPPDEYLFRIRLLDLNSNRIRSQERKKTVRSFEKNNLDVSDVLFVMQSDTGTIKLENIIPSHRIPIQEKIFAYAEIVSPGDAKAIKLESTLKQKNGKEGYNFSQEVIPQKEITKVLLQINKETMVRGENQLVLKVTSDGQLKIVRKDLQFVAGVQAFEGLPVNDMIGPLMYVTDADDWKKLNNASEAEQDSVFKAFWDKRDPSPGSSENELFTEFYRRVDISNRNFSFTRKEGWRTDRGRVYIVFGPPDRIEHSTPMGYTQADYEVWYYDELREKFVFYDEFGFGDFRLVSGNVRPAY